MKKFLSLGLMAVLFLCAMTSRAQFSVTTQKADLISVQNNKSTSELKYCSDEMQDGVGTGSPANLKAAIKIPAAMVSAYSGTKIVKIKIGIYALPASDTKVWISKRINATPLYEQAFTPSVGWNEITLNEPFTITSDDLCIGYDIKAQGYNDNSRVFGISTNEPNPNGEYIALDNNWTTLSANNISGNLSIIAVIEGEPREYLDMALTSFPLPKYLKVDSQITLKGSVYNNSNTTVTSYDIDCSINDNYTGTSTISNVSIEPGKNSTFQLPSPIILDTEGLYSIELKISGINNKTNIDAPEDDQITKQINIYNSSNIKHRKTMMEHFTTEKCPNCPAGEKFLEEVVNGNPDLIWVSNHSGFNTDKYTITEDYLWFYNDRGNVYAPAIMFNRTNFAYLGAMGLEGPAPGPVFSLDDYVSNILQESLKIPAFVSIHIGNGEYNETTKELSFDVIANKIQDLSGYNTVLNIFLLENNLPSSQPGISKHNHVLRKIISKTWGDQVNFDGNKYSKRYTCKLDDDYVNNELSIVAFLSNYDSKNANNCEVHNAEACNFNDIFKFVGIDNHTDSNIAKPYPNPVKNEINIPFPYKSISLINMSGRTIKTFNSESKINVSDVENGMYILRADNNKSFIIVINR